MSNVRFRDIIKSGNMNRATLPERVLLMPDLHAGETGRLCEPWTDGGESRPPMHWRIILDNLRRVADRTFDPLIIFVGNLGLPAEIRASGGLKDIHGTKILIPSNADIANGGRDFKRYTALGINYVTDMVTIDNGGLPVVITYEPACPLPSSYIGNVHGAFHSNACYDEDWPGWEFYGRHQLVYSDESLAPTRLSSIGRFELLRA